MSALGLNRRAPGKQRHTANQLNDSLEDFRQYPAIFLAIVIIAAIFIYAPSLRNGIMYGWDDGLYTEDVFVKKLDSESIGHFFSTYYLGMYQPVAVLSLSLNNNASTNPEVAYHATNLLIHLVNIMLVFIFLRKLSGKLFLASVAAALFAFHPMHTEAVAWISARSTLLFTTFYLLSLIYYLKTFEKHKWRNLSLAFLFFVLSAFTKSMAITLPLILVLIDHYRKTGWNRQAILEKVPFFLVSVIFGIVSINAAESYGHISDLGQDYNLLDRFFLLCYSLSFYLVKALLPVKLSAIYAYPFKNGNALPLIYYGSTIFLVGIFLVVFHIKRYRKEILFGLLFFLFTIGPVLPLFWSRFFIVAERYTYLTYVGFFFIIAFFADVFFNSDYLPLKKFKPYAVGLMLMVLIYFGAATHKRSKLWRETRDILTHVIVNSRSESSKSAAYFYRGNFRDMIKDFKGALKDYDKALEINSRYFLAFNNRGIVKGIQGDLKGSVLDFSEAIQLRPDYADAYYNRGLAYMQLGLLDEACHDWKKASSLGVQGARRFIAENCM